MINPSDVLCVYFLYADLDSVPERQENQKPEVQDGKEKQETEVKLEAPANTKPYQRIKPEPRITSDVGQRRANSYSKLTVMGVKSQPSTTATVALPDHIAAKLKKTKPQRKRSSSQSDTLQSKEQPTAYLPMTSLSQDDILMENDNAAAAQMLTGIPLEEADVFDILPARPPSNGFMYASSTSLNSLDNILVEPPPMFSEGSMTGGGTELESPQIESEPKQPQKESEVSLASSSKQGSPAGTRKPVPTPRMKNRETNHRDRAVRQFHVGHMTIEPSHVTSTTINTNYSKPLQLDDPSLVDRSSTESNDTGYTSGASPGCVPEDKNSGNTCMQEFKLKFKDDCEDTPSLSTSSGSLSVREKGKPTGSGAYDKQLSFQLSQSSITSSASDYARFYVPLIFYKPESKTDRAGLLNSFRSSPIAGASNIFSLQVCLVEDSEELLKVRAVLFLV